MVFGYGFLCFYFICKNIIIIIMKPIDSNGIFSVSFFLSFLVYHINKDSSWTGAICVALTFYYMYSKLQYNIINSGRKLSYLGLPTHLSYSSEFVVNKEIKQVPF